MTNNYNLKQLEKKLKILKNKVDCGLIPSKTQEQLDSWTPTCIRLVFNSTIGKLVLWNGSEWIEVSEDLILTNTALNLESDDSQELLINNSTEIDPEQDNLAWTITIDWVASVINITGTATGVSVGDSIGGKLIFRYKKVGGTAFDDGTISDTRTGDDSLVNNDSYLYYQIGGSDQLQIFFKSPTFLGGGSLDFTIKAEIEITEVTW